MSGSGGISELGSVILFVRDLEASVAFYRDVLGLAHRFTDHGYAEFATGPCRLGLYERPGLLGLLGPAVGDPAPGPGTPAAEILFVVGDVDAEAARLGTAGVPILHGPVDRDWGHRTLHLQDPDGHVVEVAQEIPRTRPRIAPGG